MELIAEVAEPHLSTVGKVTKLGLPADQTIGILQGVSQLEAHDAELGQAGVGGGKGAWLLVGGDVLQGDVALSGLLVMDDGVPGAEGSALHVLPADAHMVACTQTQLAYMPFPRPSPDRSSVFECSIVRAEGAPRPVH